jgi:hypothetical protein
MPAGGRCEAIVRVRGVAMRCGRLGCREHAPAASLGAGERRSIAER